MALGKIKADTLEHSTAGTVDTQFVVNGSAKAHASYAGSGTSFSSSFNCSSAVDNGTGKYSVNLSSALSATAQVTPIGSCNVNGDSSTTATTTIVVSTSAYKTNTSNDQGSFTDAAGVFSVLMGDLA